MTWIAKTRAFLRGRCYISAMKMTKSVVLLVAMLAAGIVLLVLMRSRQIPPEPEPKPDNGTVRAIQSSAVLTRIVQPPARRQQDSHITAQQPAPAARNPQIKGRIARLEVSDAVRTIVGINDKARDAKSRQQAMQKLTRNLSTADVKGLRLFLDSRAEEETAMDPIYFNSIKNDALDILLKQNNLPESIGNDIVRMFRDGAQDDTWRDYCIQYFANYYNARWPMKNDAAVEANAAAADDAERKTMVTAYWEATEGRNNTFAGTALLALERLSRDRPEFDRTQVGDKAVEVANDDNTHVASRLTALRICGMMGRTDVLPTARALSQTGSTGYLRMAAAATIGDLGDKSDIELLQSLAASTQPNMMSIAESAIKRINDRLSKADQTAK